MKNNVRICVLCMSCNQDIFKYQEIVARNTWIKHLKEEGISVFIYTSSKYNNVDIKNNKIYCNTPDDVSHTYEKTICALSQISIDNFDFIIKTNLTTYINAKLLIKYCNFLKENNYNIANGGFMINKDNIIIYRGNCLIFDNKCVNYILNNIYENKDHKADDAIWQDILKNIENIKIHDIPYRYYCNEGYFLNHPLNLKEINKNNLEGIVFISYRIVNLINNEVESGTYKSRCIELGRCYEIDIIYNQLENNHIGNNLGIIWYNDHFIKYKDLIQYDKSIHIIQDNPEDLLRIFVCAHKDFDTSVIPDKCHELIWNKDCNNELNDFNDKTYGEGYQIYEILKNKDIDKYKYIGICHYRRYYDVLSEEIIDYLDNNDCVIIEPHGLLNYTVYTQFSYFLGENGNKDIKIIGSIIKHKYNDYFKTYIDIMNGKLLYSNNMCIMKTEDWKKCFNWCFEILDEFIKKHEWKSYDDVYEYYSNNKGEKEFTEIDNISNARICGHILERLTTIYIKHNFNNIITVPLKMYKNM